MAHLSLNIPAATAATVARGSALESASSRPRSAPPHSSAGTDTGRPEISQLSSPQRWWPRAWCPSRRDKTCRTRTADCPRRQCHSTLSQASARADAPARLSGRLSRHTPRRQQARGPDASARSTRRTDMKAAVAPSSQTQSRLPPLCLGTKVNAHALLCFTRSFGSRSRAVVHRKKGRIVHF